MSSVVRGQRYGWVMLGMGIFVVFAALGLSQFSYPAILPSMQKALGFSNAQAGALATTNLVGYLGMAALGGALASRLGLRRVILVGLAACSVGMVITGLANGFALAAGGRILTGIGSALASVPAHTIPSHWFPQRRRGLVTGLITLGPALGLIVSGPLVPRLVKAYGDAGWRITWYTLAAATIVIAVAAFLVLRDRPDHEMCETSPGNERSGGWRKVYLHAPIWQLNGVYFLFGFSYMIYMTFFTKRLIADIGFSSAAAGNMFMLIGLVSLVCGVLWGYISDAVGRRRAISMVLIVQAVSYTMFALWTGTAGLTLSAVIFGLTAWAVPAIMAAACGDIVGPMLAPMAYGFLTVFHGLGQAVGPWVAGTMADSLPTFAPSYLLAAATALVGAVGAYVLFLRARARAPWPPPQTPTETQDGPE
jgi:predicted MFS family arabinose efflux permease